MIDGGPAFPCKQYDLRQGHWEGRYEVQAQFSGMSLRDYFAAAALTNQGSHNGSSPPDPETAADWAYKLADAMLARRNQ